MRLCPEMVNKYTVKPGFSITNPWPLWLRISATLVFAMMVVALLSTRLGIEHREEEIGEQLKEQSRRTIEVLSAGALEAVISEDVAILKSLIHEITELDVDIHSILISNESGRVLANHSPLAQSLPDRAYTYRHNIELEGEVFGHIVVSWDPTRLLAEVDRQLAREQKQLVLSLLTLTILSLLLLHFLVVAPLNRIRAGLLSHSSGRSTQPLKLGSSREMAMLADAVNELGLAVNESRALAKELEYQANHDLLTGLVNRGSFESILSQRLLDRTESDSEDVLFYIDLDQFKIVNDTSGHAAGDVLLRQFSMILKKIIGDDEVFARLGGDEFAILLISTPLQQAIEIAETIRAKTEEFRFSWKDQSFSVEVSIGVVPVSGYGYTMQDVLAAADEACYAAKNAGRNRVHVYQENDTAVSTRRHEMSLLPGIRDAIENSRMSLFGQIIEPAVATDDHERRIEVLVRMLSDSGEMLLPGAFLPAAERYGVVPHIDRWVFTNTLTWLAHHVERGEPLPVCAINLSGMSISDEDFCQFVLDSLDRSLIPNNDRICFEITETAAVANLATATQFMHAVKARGCSFALDDFGAGMSSFTYLKNLPVDYIKIDGSIVRDVLTDRTSIVMVRAIADIARVMGIQSIAEFVENEDIRQKLGDIGIDYVQGYGVGRPQSLKQFGQYVREVA